MPRSGNVVDLRSWSCHLRDYSGGEIVLTLLLRVREVGRGWQILLPSLPLNREAETLGDEPAYVVELREYSKLRSRPTVIICRERLAFSKHLGWPNFFKSVSLSSIFEFFAIFAYFLAVFGYFWLLLGYFLATFRLLFWLLFGYFLATFRLLFGHFLATFRLLFGYFLATFWHFFEVIDKLSENIQKLNKILD